MNEWIKLATQNDINILMNNFSEFHDSCIAEFRYTTGMFVDEENKGMGADNEKSNIVLFLQSQWSGPIELSFTGIKELNINGNEKYFANIYEVNFYIKDDLIYFIIDGDVDKNNFSMETTYIICKKVMYKNVKQ